jgi:hypothetical protein
MPCNELCFKLSLWCPENTKCKLVPNYCARERSKSSCNVLNRDGSGRNRTLQILQTSMNRDEDDYLLNVRANHVFYVPHNAVWLTLCRHTCQIQHTIWSYVAYSKTMQHISLTLSSIKHQWLRNSSPGCFRCGLCVSLQYYYPGRSHIPKLSAAEGP